MGAVQVTIKFDLSLFGNESERLNPYKEHFLLNNPFPGYGEIELEVCTNQKEIKKKFVGHLRDFHSGTKRMRINGENGAGKTNILRYFEQLTDQARQTGRINNIYPIYVSAPEETYFDIHAQIVEKLSELFLDDLLRTLQLDQEQLKMLLEKVKPASEPLGAIKAIIGRRETLGNIFAQRQEDIFVRWLKGQKLTATDRDLLKDKMTQDGGIRSDIGSPSLAIRFLDGLLTVLKELRLCDGIVLLFDEFEEIFEGLTRTRQSRYAQDLRHLLDTLKDSVFFVIATVPEPKDLGQYPAIERRLGDPVELQPIDSLEVAKKYVLDYLESGRDKFEIFSGEIVNTYCKRRPTELEPLSVEIVMEEFQILKEEGEQVGLHVLPGYFLPRIRERIKQIVEG